MHGTGRVKDTTRTTATDVVMVSPWCLRKFGTYLTLQSWFDRNFGHTSIIIFTGVFEKDFTYVFKNTFDDDDDELFLKDCSPTNSRQPHFQKSPSPGNLTVVTFKHAEVRIVALPLHHGAINPICTLCPLTAVF